MKLNTTDEGLVTPLTTVRAIRDISVETLARRVQRPTLDVLAWDLGKAPIPNEAMAKRLGMALMWPWRDLLERPVPYDVAWQALVDARQRIVMAR